MADQELDDEQQRQFPWAGLPGGQTLGQLGQLLVDPTAQGALLSTGLALMSPRPFGQTPEGALAQAIAAGGESVRTQEASRLKERDIESRADAREARAGAAGARAETAAARLDAQRFAQEQVNERNRLNQRVRLSVLYQNYVKQTTDQNAFAPKDQQQPILPMDKWIANNPMLKSLGLIPAMPTETSDEEPGGEGSPAAGGGVPPAPRDPSKRTAGQRYQTPKGVLLWNGTAWEQ